MKISIRYTFFFLFFSTILIAQSDKERFESINIEHYKLAIEVNDATNKIKAEMKIFMRFRKNVTSFDLDLVEQDAKTGEGMKVDSIYQNNASVDFKQKNNKLTITPKHIFPNLTYTYTIKYSGVPKSGLIIGKNKFGDRTFFGDNWPNRAQNWFPCVDHPSDKATVEFIVKAPKKYQVIANGVKVRDTILKNNVRLTHYQNKEVLPTKVMVIGIANFAVEKLGETQGVPVSNWVYPQNEKEGFDDFSNAPAILDYFIETIGEFPFQKLANVQSSTEYGGMENASAIFYPENAITGERKIDALMAHEIAHQWFGDAVTESNWSQIWLSEGFATYFADLYVQKSKGDSVFQRRMGFERKKVLDFYKKQQTPVVDIKTTNLIDLLNPNSYEKGAWVLHMLRKKLGDDVFFKGIKAYYSNYKYSNASTARFQSVMQQVSGKNLDVFFNQWLTLSEYPILKSNWIYYNNKVRLMLDQTQNTAFEFPLDVELIYTDGTSEIKTIQVTYKTEPFVIEGSGEVKELKFDPNNWLLFQLAEE
ncbi:M1 family metallopeptidase [Flavobacterium sp.]|uniref:M1 family metallopeptidase n=1 Tax=Flavobacterium sp. TaxID=239 RepID=UPI00404716B3